MNKQCFCAVETSNQPLMFGLVQSAERCAERVSSHRWDMSVPVEPSAGPLCHEPPHVFLFKMAEGWFSQVYLISKNTLIYIHTQGARWAGF